MRAVADRVRESITIDPHTHCWIWTRARNVSGYGRMRVGAGSPKAARASAKVRLAKTHCPKGHPYEGTNVINKRGGRRQCRTCTVASTRRWRAWRANEVAD
jgi:hypothetical protein